MIHIEPKAGNYCFGCGLTNPFGLRMSFTYDPDARAVHSQYVAPEHFRGVEGKLHGGMIAVLLDEASSKVMSGMGIHAVTNSLRISYVRPVPTETELAIKARYSRQEADRHWVEAEIAQIDGEILACSKGIFVAVNPDFANTLG